MPHTRRVDGTWRSLIRSLFGLKPTTSAPRFTHPERRKDHRAPSDVEVTLQWDETGGKSSSAQGTLENVSRQGFAVRTESLVPDGQTVWVTRPDSPPLKSVVRHVGRSRGSNLLGLARVALERRREDRQPVEGAALLRRTGPNGETIATDVEIHNVSPEGVQVVSPEAVPKADVARLIGQAVECMGTVRYSVPWNGKFLVGLFLIGSVKPKTPSDRLFA